MYGETNHPSAELAPSGAIRSRFVYGTSAQVPDYMVRGGDKYRLIRDQLGSVRLVVDTATGAVAQRLDYDAWGRVTQNTNPDFQPFGYAGGFYDGDTHLVRFGVRDYDPEVGRWTMKDPIDFDGGDTNLYAYVANDPINLTDSSGLFIDTVVDAGFLAVSTGKWIGGCGSLGDVFLDGAGIFVPGVVGLSHWDDAAAIARYGDDVPVSGPVGRKGNPLHIWDGTNRPGSVNDRDYSGHAFDRMQGRGIPPSAVEDDQARGVVSGICWSNGSLQSSKQCERCCESKWKRDYRELWAPLTITLLGLRRMATVSCSTILPKRLTVIRPGKQA